MFPDHTLLGSYELLVLLKLLLAAVAGGTIGLEREKHGRPAGLRTHLLVAVGSCLMMIVSEGFFLKYGGMDSASPVRLDPGRVAAQIVTGIGFLGAGVILREGMNVRGLTTAASLWVVAGLGMAFGMGLATPGVMATLLALFSLFFLKRLEPAVKKDRYLHLSVTASSEKEIYDDLEKLLVEKGLRVADLSSQLDIENREVCFEFVLTRHYRRMGRELSQEIAMLDGVKRIRFK